MAENICALNCSHCRCYDRNEILNSIQELRRNWDRYFYRENALMGLGIIEQDVESNSPVRWKAITPVLREMKVKDTTSSLCSKFTEELISLMEKFPCRDLYIISEIFFIKHYSTVNCDTHSLHIAWMPGFFNRFRTSCIKNIMEAFCTPYGFKKNDRDLVWRAAMHGKPHLLKLQLKFGMATTIPYFDLWTSLKFVGLVLSPR